MAERDVAAILKAGDLARTIDWYRSAGFALLGTFPEDEPTWAALGRDGPVSDPDGYFVTFTEPL